MQSHTKYRVVYIKSMEGWMEGQIDRLLNRQVEIKGWKQVIALQSLFNIQHLNNSMPQ